MTREEAVPLEVQLTERARHIMPTVPAIGEPGEGDPEEIVDEYEHAGAENDDEDSLET